MGKEGSDNSSGGSTPEPPAPFIQKYSVQFSDHVTKDGDAVKFSLQIFKNDEFVQLIERVYEDFEYLEHCVITDQLSHGLIVPPLPLLIAVDAESAVAHSKKNMGKGSKLVLGDDFRKDCLQLEKYLNFLLQHPVFGQSPRLQQYLLSIEAPPRIKLKKGLLSKIAHTLEARKVTYPDCEDFFQKERDNALKYKPAIQEFCENFNSTIFAQIKILNQFEQMIIALRLNPNLKSGPPNYLDLNQNFLNCIDQTKNELEDKIVSEDLEAGCVFSFWKNYVVAEDAMLLTRTSLMIDYQMCNRALDKVKPNRKHIAELAQKSSEEAFERCSDTARKEIKRFHVVRTSEMLKAVLWYMHHQVASTRRSIGVLSAALSKVRAIPSLS